MELASYSKGWHEVASGTFAYLQPRGQWGYSNAGFVAGEGSNLLVDTLFSVSLTAEMLASLEVKTGRRVAIDWLVNTHANGDHCYGNQLVRGAKIVSSASTANEVAHDDPALLKGTLEIADQLGDVGAYFVKCFGDFDFEGIDITPPDVTFTSEMALDVGGRDVVLMELGPAHTSGDVIVHVPDEGVLYSGDLLFIGGTPIMWAGPLAHWIEACDAMTALDPMIVVPGHGPLTDLGGIADVRSYLEFVDSESRRCFERGMDPWAATLAIDLGRYAAWLDAERIAVNIAMAYHEIDPANFHRVQPLEAFTMMSNYLRHVG